MTVDESKICNSKKINNIVRHVIYTNYLKLHYSIDGKFKTIADVAVRKSHHQLDEILIFLLALYLKSAKLFYKKTLSVTHAFITSVCFMKYAQLKQLRKLMLCNLACVKCRVGILQSFLFKSLRISLMMCELK